MNKVILTLIFFVLSDVSFSGVSKQCRSLVELENKNIKIRQAKIVSANKELPEYCRITGTIFPEIGFEMRFPTEGWNGKFYMAGCGAFCGQVGSDVPGFINSMNYGLKRNYAVAATDSGHQAKSKSESLWAYNNRDGEINWGHRAVHRTANVTKAAIEDFYGKGPELSYFAGCSTGGRMAAMEAWRYPEDFDGVISGAPALNYQKLLAVYFAWMQQQNTDEYGREIISAEDTVVLEKHIYDKCDENDGVKDRVIDDPSTCEFEPKALLCKGEKKDTCFTEKQVNALEKLYAEPKNSRGEPLFPGAVPVGGEHSWRIWFTDRAKTVDGKIPEQKKMLAKDKGFMSDLNQNFLSYMAFEHDPGEDISPLTFDFDLHPKKLDVMGKIYNSDDPDISAFAKRGGKMLLWHGWGDMIIPPSMSIDYYDRMTDLFGGVEQTQAFARFFLFPGVDHCGLVPGPGASQDGFDLLTALEKWVEKDQAPEQILMTKFKHENVAGKEKQPLWTRPACAYPKIARYMGKGDASVPESYRCE